MDSNSLIDAQFDRAVEIVQGLPQGGPIQTGYEEKLALYSLYKQATVGNVKASRPGLFDMLGRAKWDAWAKQKDLDSAEAKWRYVETLQKILRKYADTPIARELGRELASYGGDPANLVMSGSLVQSGADRTSSSDESEDEEEEAAGQFPQHYPIQTLRQRQQQAPAESSSDDGGETSEEETVPSGMPAPIHYRPQSALSSHLRYRTPMAPSTSFSPIPVQQLVQHTQYPVAQPLPRYATPSAFDPHQNHPDLTSPSGGGVPSTIVSSSGFPPSTSMSYPMHLSHSSMPYGPNPLNMHTHNQQQQQPLQRPPLERAVESVQASLAALRERLEGLEGSGSNPSLSRNNLIPGGGVAGNPNIARPPNDYPPHRPFIWDPANMGLWSLVLLPATRTVSYIHTILAFILTPLPSPTHTGGRRSLRSGTRSTIVRRLALDASFVLAVLFALSRVWKASGVRRKEVYRALGGVWAAIVGRGFEGGGGRPKRVMVDRGV